MKTYIMVLALLLVSVIKLSAQPKEILLWPNGAPGSAGKTAAEKIRVAAVAVFGTEFDIAHQIAGKTH